jgi:hypothetical protein
VKMLAEMLKKHAVALRSNYIRNEINYRDYL